MLLLSAESVVDSSSALAVDVDILCDCLEGMDSLKSFGLNAG